MINIKFKEINKNVIEEDIQFLFDLLESREFSISHEEMPTFNDHKEFVMMNPYYKWCIIKVNEKSIGSFYINMDNSVGIRLLKKQTKYLELVLIEFRKQFTPQPAIKSVRYKDFFFNINPLDKLMLKVLKKNGYKISQLTLKKF